MVCHTCADRDRLNSHLNDSPRIPGGTVVMVPFDPDRAVDEKKDLEDLERQAKRHWQNPDDLPSY